MSRFRSQSHTARAEAAGRVGLVDLVVRLRREFHDQTWKVAILCGLSILSALAEAATLAMFVPLAFAVSTGHGKAFSTRLGGLLSEPLELSVPWLIIATLFAVACRAVLQVTVAWVDSRLATSYEARVRRLLVQGFLQSSWDLQSSERVGLLQALATENVAMGMKALHSISQGMVAICNFTVLIAVAFAIAPLAALAILATAVLIFAISRPINQLAHKHAYRKNDLIMQFAGEVNQAVLMAREIRTFNVRGFVEEHLNKLVGKIRRTRMASLILSALLPVVYQSTVLLLLVSGLAAAFFGGFGNMEGVGTVALLLLRALTYSQAFQQTFHHVVEAVPFIDELERQQQRYQTHRIALDGTPMEHFESVTFEDVTFEYVPKTPVLKNLSFEVHRGQMIGIIGPSGSGKTTLMQLLLRLRDPSTGRVLINGRPAEEFSLSSWYERVAFVPQEPLMFNETVGNCIRFFRPGLSQAALEEAARGAGILHDILSWSAGFDTPAGERGGHLSGGQRQRVCIARALVSDPEVIIFDEPTSALDVNAEAVILETLEQLKGRVTAFVIAHRLSTLAYCDKIMILRNGQLESYATPRELALNDEYFQQAQKLAGLVSDN